MIQNDEQLNVIEYWIEVFKKAINDKESLRPFWESHTHSILHQAELDGMKSKLIELEQEVKLYNNGKDTAPKNKGA